MSGAPPARSTDAPRPEGTPGGGDGAGPGPGAGRRAPPAASRALAWTCGVLAAVYAAAIFWESSRPNPFPFVPPSILSHDKLLHAAGYAVLGALVRVAFAGGRRFLHPVAIAVALAAAYGASDEVHQWFVPGRSADPFDWAADALGALAGAALASAFLRRRVGAGSIRP